MEVKSEQGGMAGREPFAMGLQASPVQSQPPLLPNMRLAFTSDGTAIYKPVAGVAPTFSSGGEAAVVESGGAMPVHGLQMGSVEPSMKRKRGRPRKYGPDGTMALALSPVSGVGSGQTAGSPLSGSSPATKKARGRPPGSGRKQQMAALGSAGIGFTPHVITVKAGEDVASKIMSFSQHGPRAVCILTANGSISNVTLRQAAMSGGTVTYEGRFEILSLSGSFLLTESGGQRSRTGGMSVSLAGPDGRVLGGGVAGQLTAASPVQVVVGSFIADGGRKETRPAILPETPPATQSTTGGGAPASPPPRATLGEAGGDATGSPRPSPGSGNAPFNNGGQPAMPAVIWK
ncbi:AT hook motif DNA-binding family protein [Wolffia australiana]